MEFEPTTTDFRSDALTDWGIKPWVQLVLRANFVQLLQFHRLVSVKFHFDYLQSEDGLVWLWNLLVNLYICLTTSSCYGSIPLTLGLIERDGGLSTLCRGCGLASQQRVLKMFPGPGYLRSEDDIYIYMIFTFEGFFRSSYKSWPDWDIWAHDHWITFKRFNWLSC